MNPANDGSVIRVPIPPLTEDRRREYVRMVKQKAEEARVAIRNVRRDEVHRVHEREKKGELAEDASRRAQEQLQKVTDVHVGRVDAPHPVRLAAAGAEPEGRLRAERERPAVLHEHAGAARPRAPRVPPGGFWKLIIPSFPSGAGIVMLAMPQPGY